MPVITLDNGIKKTYKRAITLQEIFKDIYPEHESYIIAGFVNQRLVDVTALITEHATVIMVDENNKQFLSMVRRSGIQLLNRVLKLMWPAVKIAGGEITKSGFYCDIDMPSVLAKKDLKKISEKMLEEISSGYNIFSKHVRKKYFLDCLKKEDELYQISLINKHALKEKNINISCHKEYCEFCSQEQVPNIKFCRYFFLQDISGAYWNADKNNKMLQRIHVLSFLSKTQLLKFINRKEKLEKRDHRKIAKLLNLYHIQKESPGMVFWHHNGYIIFRQLENFIRLKLFQNNYLEVKSPIVIDKSLWEKSGHCEYYSKSIFLTQSENRQYCIKPMSCPAHVQIFQDSLKSYRDLPIRMAEFGSCHRQESSGSLHGLMRVRGFTQDDAHIFCSKDQIKPELNHCIRLLFDLYHAFGFKKIIIKFSTRPKNRIGSDDLWNQAENDLESVLVENNLSFQYQLGEGAFYGPKIEIALEDNLKRIWQCGTIQLDFYLAKKLKAYYMDRNNIKKYPIIIHRAFLGSIERFIGILIEEYDGKLPIWLSPTQAVVISVSKQHIAFVKKIEKKLLFHNIRVTSDVTNNSVGFKIREYIKQHVPYILVCGDKEVKKNYVTIRARNNNKQYQQTIDYFITKILDSIKYYSIQDFKVEG
ncbi:threonine--tRNA ligase [Buchnera aphidicola]|uniref:threonine--tRNA ligase n=1 Tax=Buchnera aphidicola TaxID=9 RepID=UPI00094C553E|nr:threonine--tRNA ligase [Buchnera aphidicola]